MSAAMTKPKGKLKAVPKAPSPVEDGEDFVMDAKFFTAKPPAVKNGAYSVAFTGEWKKIWMHGHTRLVLNFQILDEGEFYGAVVPMMARISPVGGRIGLSHSSKFVRAVTVALGHHPARTDKRIVSTAHFKGKVFRADIYLVVRDAKRRVFPPELQYSVISMLLERLTGNDGPQQ